LVFSGAGLSAESGIPTFRASDGLWEGHKVEEVASHDAWYENPALMLKFYEERFNKLQEVQPNEAHSQFARLEEKFRVVHITQNVDDLLERAGCKEVHHLHGTLVHRKCSNHKNIRPDFTCNYLATQNEPVKMGDLCPSCGSQLRPNVVWFGELTDMPNKLIAELQRSMPGNNGVFVCVGTSAQVYPAAGIIKMFGNVQRRYLVDLSGMKLPKFVTMQGKATEQVKALVDKLMDE
jgi:NAD-dependent deacetylase